MMALKRYSTTRLPTSARKGPRDQIDGISPIFDESNLDAPTLAPGFDSTCSGSSARVQLRADEQREASDRAEARDNGSIAVAIETTTSKAAKPQERSSPSTKRRPDPRHGVAPGWSKPAERHVPATARAEILQNLGGPLRLNARDGVLSSS